MSIAPCRCVTSPTSIDAPAMPASYAARLVLFLESRGVAAEGVLDGTSLSRAALDDPGLRIPTEVLGQMLRNGAALTGDAGLGLALGLSLNVSSHGPLGLAAMTCGSLRGALALGERYMELRASPWRIRVEVQGDLAIMRLVELASIAGERTLVLELVLGAMIRLGEFLLGEPPTHPAIEFWSDSPEQPHHARFAGQIPRVRYNCASNEARFPASWLDRPLALREAVTNREAVHALETERRRLGPREDLLARTRELLGDPAHRFPDLEHAARTLGVSSRTLRRHLSDRGTPFQLLRDQLRRDHAIALIEQSSLVLDEVASALGYADRRSFLRAFARWTGQTPTSFRRGPRLAPRAMPGGDAGLDSQRR